MKLKFLRWNRRRRFIKAYRILRNNVERHKVAGHDIEFMAINESLVVMRCENCPELQP